MPFFKYFRPGVYLDKAIRYNELYFSANHELNNPNDLKAFYRFEDDEAGWERLFHMKRYSDAWDLRHAVCLENPVFISDINNYFKDKKIESEFFHYRIFSETIKNPYGRFFTSTCSRFLKDPLVWLSGEITAMKPWWKCVSSA